MRLGGQPGFEYTLGSAWDHVQEPGVTVAVWYGSYGDVFVAVGGVVPHVFIHADDTHAVEPGRGVDERALTFGQEAVLAALPGHAQGLGDAHHRQMVDDQVRERPAHRRQ